MLQHLIKCVVQWHDAVAGRAACQSGSSKCQDIDLHLVAYATAFTVRYLPTFQYSSTGGF